MVRFAKIVLTSLVTLNSVLLSADTLYIPKVGYSVWYDTHLGVPVKSDYVLARANLHRVATRKGMDFYPDLVLPKPQVSSSCYRKSGYDRGHNVPAADRLCSNEMLIETFAMSNVAPQLPRFNRKEWKRIENLVRSLARHLGAVRVITSPVFIYDDTLWLPCHHVAVPDGFRKQVYRWPSLDLLIDTTLWQRRKPRGGLETITR